MASEGERERARGTCFQFQVRPTTGAGEQRSTRMLPTARAAAAGAAVVVRVTELLLLLQCDYTLSGRGPAFFSSFVQRRRQSETPQADGKKKKKRNFLSLFLSFFLLCLRVVFLLFTFTLLPTIHLLT